LKELDLITIRQNYLTFEGLLSFGNFELLQLDKFNIPSAQKWDPCYIYSIEGSVVFALNYDRTLKYM